MTEPLTPEREADLRRLANGEDWSPAQHEDLAVLFAEIDRLRGDVRATPPIPEFTRTEQTCFGCPSQWDAWDADGNQYYLRFRWGVGSISLTGRMVDGEIKYLDRSEEIVSFDTNDGLDGIIGLEEFLDRARGNGEA